MDPNALPEEECDVAPAETTDGPAGARPQTGAGRWNESSWDLCRGLTVHEGLPADAGLDEWLEALLRE